MTALLVMAAARFVPLSASLYVGGVAGVVAMWPLAYAMWRSAARTHDREATMAGATPVT